MYGHPLGEKTPGIIYPSGHTGNPGPYGPERSGAIGGVAVLYAPRGSRVGGSPVPHPTRSDPGGSIPGMAVARLSAQDRGLAGTRAAGGGQAYTPVRDRP